MDKTKVSLQTIADHLGVSKVTVYKALNNQKYVSDTLREQILQAAHAMGYIKANKKTNSLNNKLAFIVPKIFFFEDESFYTTIYYHLNNACHKDEIALTLYVINSADESTLKLPPSLNSKDFDGIFIAGEMTDAYIHSIEKFGLPMMLIDFYKQDLDHDCVIADNFINGYSVTNYLIGKGHTSIGFLGDQYSSTSSTDRFFGYQKALAKHNLKYDPSWHLINNDPNTGVYFLNITLPLQLPTAYVCNCDLAAYFLIQSLNMANICVPKDISIISFDNTKLAQNCIPPLTSIDINTETIANKAYKQLHNRINKPDMQKQRLYITCDIIVRDSILEI